MRVAKETLAVLSASSLTEQGLVLPGQLDRKSYTAANKALEAAGWKWSRAKKAHVAPDGEGEAKDALDRLLLTGEVVSKKQEFGFFETPPAVIRVLLALADIKSGHWVLEPSAGGGKIVMAIIRTLDRGRVEFCELQPGLFDLTRARVAEEYPLRAVTGIAGDFLTLKPHAAFDRVVMNPPFARQADIDHVLHAYKFLAPGGLLVSVMSAGAKFREDRKAREFRAAIDEYGELQDLPDGSFKSSGTDVSTVVCVWRRPS